MNCHVLLSGDLFQFLLSGERQTLTRRRVGFPIPGIRTGAGGTRTGVSKHGKPEESVKATSGLGWVLARF